MKQVSVTTPPGDETAWFWAHDCASDCNHSIASAELNLTWGWAAEGEADVGYAVGMGLSGVAYPYADGYVQLRGGRSPYGVGARVGIPITGWNEYQVYGRYDVRLQDRSRILLNPGVFYHVGNSPNGQNPGRMLAFVQGIGLTQEGRTATFIPAATLVLGRGSRESSIERIGPFTTAFAVFSLSVTYHRERK